MSVLKTFSESQARKRRAMKAQAKMALMSYSRSRPNRLFALWYFSVMLVLWTVLGHTVLGFQQSWAIPVVGLTTAILMQILVEWLNAKSREREPGFIGKPGAMANVLQAIVLLSGFVVHLLSTGRLLLCLAWVGGFVLQAVLRH